jgi:cytochrome c
MAAPSWRLACAAIAAALLAACATAPSADAAMASAECLEARAAPGTRVLVFSRTEGFRHGSIRAGATAIRQLGQRYGFEVEHTEDPATFTPVSLARFDAVVFLNTTGDVLDRPQESAFEEYIRAGGGFVGVHAAADTEYDWEWYGRLVGAYFRSHPRTQPATIVRSDSAHLSMRCVPDRWTRVDEWYDYRAAPAEGVRILATLDETSYTGGRMGAFHPIAWYHPFQGGRAWYTGLGHTTESYSEPEFLYHLAGGILWATGQ